MEAGSVLRCLEDEFLSLQWTCRYRVEGEMNAEPEIVFKYIDPHPQSLRSSVDKAIKELQTVASISEVKRTSCTPNILRFQCVKSTTS